MLSRKRYQDASENLGLYWTRRRETCIELLNKFTSFQLVVCFFSLFFASFDSAATLIKSLLLYYIHSNTQLSTTILLGWAHFMWISYSTSSSRFIYQDFFYFMPLVSCLVPFANSFMKWNFILGIHRQIHVVSVVTVFIFTFGTTNRMKIIQAKSRS